MTTIEESAAVDPDKLMSFVFKAVDEVGATLNAALVVMGDKLGLYQDLRTRHSALDLRRSARPAPRAQSPRRGTAGAHALTHARTRPFTAAGFSTCRKWPAPSTTSILDPDAR